MKALVLTVSDRASRGVRADRSGPVAAECLQAAGFEVRSRVVADEPGDIVAALGAAVCDEVDVVITTGGTGLGPRDRTPEATQEVIERAAPGLADLVRASGSVPTAALSRGIAGAAGRTLIVNLAGSPGAVTDGMAALTPLLHHAVEQLRGGDH